MRDSPPPSAAVSPAPSSAAPGPPPSAAASAGPSVLAAPTAGPSVPADVWTEVVTEVRGRSRFLGEALAGTTPGPLEGSTLPLVLAESNPLFAERIQAQAGVVEEVIQRHAGRTLRIRVTVGEGAAVPKPRPITETSLRADRLRSFRDKDPALDTAADALDLEIVD